jgi:hypothetical protein
LANDFALSLALAMDSATARMLASDRALDFYLTCDLAWTEAVDLTAVTEENNRAIVNVYRMHFFIFNSIIIICKI